MASSKADVLESLDLANRALAAATVVAQGLPDQAPDPPPPPPPPPDPPAVVNTGNDDLKGIGIYDVNDSGLHQSGYRFGWRLVIEQKADALILPFKSQGTDYYAPYSGTGHTYGDGTGGRIVVTRHADKDGKPDLANVLDQDEFSASVRWQQTMQAYGITQQSHQFFRVALEIDTPGVWWLVARNVDGAPSKNYISPNSPIGPGRSNLDPREVVAWSPDAGMTWQFGRNAGHYQSAYARMPWYGLEVGDQAFQGQPYYAYKENVAPTGIDRLVTARRPITKLIVHGPSPGTVKARNQRTGQSVSIPSQNGYQEHAIVLDAVAGDKIELSASGSLYTAEADIFIRETFDGIVDEVQQIAVV